VKTIAEKGVLDLIERSPLEEEMGSPPPIKKKKEGGGGRGVKKKEGQTWYILSKSETPFTEENWGGKKFGTSFQIKTGNKGKKNRRKDGRGYIAKERKNRRSEIAGHY